MTEPGPARAPLDLRRPRDLGALLNDGVRLYFREFPTFFLIALVVVVPVEVIVSGIGLGQIGAEYDSSPPPEVTLIPALAEALVVSPLLTSMCIFAMLDAADGRKPSARTAIQRGLDVFGALLVVMLMFIVALVLGLFVLIVGAVIAAVYLAFVMQAAVVDGSRGLDALRRSFEIVRGSWWRVFAVALLAFLLTNLAAGAVGTPLLSVAESSGDAAYALAGRTLGAVLFAPPFALVMTLLYFDQRARKGV